MEETILERLLRVVKKIKVGRVPETANEETGNEEKTHIYQAVEKVVRLAVTRGAVNVPIDMEVDYLAESQDFFLLLLNNFIENPSITVTII